MTLQVAEQAPDFALKNQHGETVRLSQFRDKQAVVVVFYPWAFSGVCGGELHDLQKHLDEFQNDDVAVLTISTDADVCAACSSADWEGFTFPDVAYSGRTGRWRRRTTSSTRRSESRCAPRSSSTGQGSCAGR